MKEKLNGLDAVRTLACLAIFTFHCHLNRLGPWAVSVFFILSGFLLVYNYLDRDMPEKPGIKYCFGFSVKRIKKLYPLHIICLCVTFVFVIVIRRFNMSGEQWRFMISTFFASAALVQSWVPDQEFAMNLNGVAWYLSDLVFLYMCFPLILGGIKKYRSRGRVLLGMGLTVALMIGAGAAAMAAYDARHGLGAATENGFDMWAAYILPLYRLGDFVLGCHLGWLFLNRAEKRPSVGKGTLLEVLALGLNIFAYWVFCTDELPKWFCNTGLYLVPSAVFIYVFALDSGYISKLMHNKPVAFISALSSEIFLIHQVVVNIGTALVNMLPIPLMAMKVLGLSGICVMTLLLSWLYSRYWGSMRRGKKSA